MLLIIRNLNALKINIKKVYVYIIFVNICIYIKNILKPNKSLYKDTNIFIYNTYYLPLKL